MFRPVRSALSPVCAVSAVNTGLFGLRPILFPSNISDHFINASASWSGQLVDRQDTSELYFRETVILCKPCSLIKICCEILQTNLFITIIWLNCYPLNSNNWKDEENQAQPVWSTSRILTNAILLDPGNKCRSIGTLIKYPVFLIRDILLMLGWSEFVSYSTWHQLEYYNKGWSNFVSLLT